jgi:hypothetical protein
MPKRDQSSQLGSVISMADFDLNVFPPGKRLRPEPIKIDFRNVFQAELIVSDR